LLDYFGIKNGGRNPQSLAEVIAPVLDLDRWYKVESEEYLQGGISGHSSAGWVSASPTLLVVPAGEVWHVHAFSVTIAIPQSQTLIFAPLSTRVPEGGFVTGGMPVLPEVATIVTPAAVATYTYQVGTDWQGWGRYFRQNTVFGSAITSITTTMDFTWQLRFSRFRR
jgi:hypothetical protein